MGNQSVRTIAASICGTLPTYSILAQVFVLSVLFNACVASNDGVFAETETSSTGSGDVDDAVAVSPDDVLARVVMRVGGEGSSSDSASAIAGNQEAGTVGPEVINLAAPSSTCGELIRHGLRDIQTMSSDEASTFHAYSHICDSEMSDEESRVRSDVSASYMFIFGAHVDVDVETIRRFRSERCGSDASWRSGSSSASSNSRRINDRAVDAWRACVSATSTGIRASINIPDHQTATLGLAWYGTGSGANLLAEPYFVPTDSWECETIGSNGTSSSYPMPIRNGLVSIRCQRLSVDEDGERVFPQSSIIVTTDVDNFVLPFPEVRTSPSIEINALAAEVRQLRIELDAERQRNDLDAERLGGLLGLLNGMSRDSDGWLNVPRLRVLSDFSLTENVGGGCRWVGVSEGVGGLHHPTSRRLCAANEQLASFDLHGCEHGGNCPDVRRVLCCRL